MQTFLCPDSNAERQIVRVFRRADAEVQTEAKHLASPRTACEESLDVREHLKRCIAAS